MRSGNDNVCPSRQQAFENLKHLWSLSRLAFEDDAGCGNLMQNIEVDAGEVTVVSLARTLRFKCGRDVSSAQTGVMPEILVRRSFLRRS